MAKAAQVYGLTVDILSLEQDARWASLVREHIDGEGMRASIHILHVPTRDDGTFAEFDLPQHFRKTRFDLVIIDGPTAYAPHLYGARLGNKAIFEDRLQEAAAILVDDVDRAHDLTLLRSFVADGFAVQRLYDSVGLAVRGSAQDSAPIRD